MASVSDVYNQLVTANSHLSNIHNDDVSLHGAVNSVAQELNTGFATLAADDQVIANILHQVDTTVLHLSGQTDSALCTLEQIAKGVCVLVNQGAEQTTLLRRIADDGHALREMFATSHPEAALVEARAKAVVARMDTCCPPEPTSPVCVHEPCPRPTPLDENPVSYEFPPYPQGNDVPK